MSTATITHPAAPNPGDQGIGRGGLIIIGMPVLIVALCFANYFGLITIPPGPRVVMIFVLLISMMTTGMPISIALGLTVLIFIFTMTEVPIDAVALKLRKSKPETEDAVCHASGVSKNGSRRRTTILTPSMPCPLGNLTRP